MKTTDNAKSAAGTLNIDSDSADERAVHCSNFTLAPFVIDGIRFESAEGFIQAIMWPEDHENHALGQRLEGRAAKKLGRKAEREFVWWQGRKFAFGSAAHFGLIERALREKFAQNPRSMRGLLATAGLTLIHDLGHPERPDTSLPAHFFCEMLVRIRDGKPMMYPCGTPTQPIVITVSKVRRGHNMTCVAKARVGGTIVLERPNDSRAAAIHYLIATLAAAQPTLVLQFGEGALDAP